jgi:hypothetical protein
MKADVSLSALPRNDAPVRPSTILLFAVAALALFAANPPRTRAQTFPSGNRDRLSLSAGATGSGAYLQYGERTMVGASGFVDADTRRRLGIEAEGRWIEFRQTAGVHVETYSAGLRYHFDLGRFQPYIKGLAGLGDFNYPYNLATGRYLVATAGGGVDLLAGHRFQIRAADVEYQFWPQFTFGNMASFAVSAGLRVRIF